MSMQEVLRLWGEVSERNLNDGFPQLNSLHWVLKHFPHLAPKLESLTLKLRDTHYSPTVFSEWLKVYKVACREFREHHLEGCQPREETIHSRRKNRANPHSHRDSRVDLQQEKLL